MWGYRKPNQERPMVIDEAEKSQPAYTLPDNRHIASNSMLIAGEGC
jgi:hypothetical protein